MCLIDETFPSVGTSASKKLQPNWAIQIAAWMRKLLNLIIGSIRFSPDVSHLAAAFLVYALFSLDDLCRSSAISIPHAQQSAEAAEYLNYVYFFWIVLLQRRFANLNLQFFYLCINLLMFFCSSIARCRIVSHLMIRFVCKKLLFNILKRPSSSKKKFFFCSLS